METPDFLTQDEVYENSTETSPEWIHIKVEQSVDLSENTTDDENVAVEALQSLSGVRTKSTHHCPNCSCLQPSKEELAKHLILCSGLSTTNTEIATNSAKANKCLICKTTFDKISELNNHLVCHASSRPHACRICGSLFIHKRDLDNHLPTHGIESSYQCKTCRTKFTRMSALTNHMKIHTYIAGREAVDKINDTNELEDILTGSSDPELEAVQVDTDQSRANKLVLPSITNITSLTMPSSATWINYESEAYNLSDINPNIPNLNDGHHHNMGVAQVVEVASSLPVVDITLPSPTSTPSASSAYEHEIVDARPYKCDKCNKSFARHKAYVNHMNNHFTCDRCDQHFSSARALESHRKYCGNNDVKNIRNFSPPAEITPNVNGSMEEEGNVKHCKHVCDVCGKRFSTKQKLFRHVWIHRKKLFICEVCSESFGDVQALDAHRIATHPSGGLYDCGQCGKSFCSRQGLWEHGRTHSKDVIHFKCDICQKTFTSRQGFLIHKRTHSDERPYGCRYCMKSFRDGGTLRKHERIHTGERPHACPVCAKTFNQKVVLREHIRWLHANASSKNEEGVYPCQLCEFAFAEMDELSAHYMKHSDKLVQIAKAASRNNIREQTEVLPTNAKRRKVDDLTMVQCQVQINEENSNNGENTNCPLQNVGQDGAGSSHNGSVIEYQPKVEQTHEQRLAEVKVEFETVETDGAEAMDLDGMNVVVFACEMCNITFDNKDDLRRHVKVHM